MWVHAADLVGWLVCGEAPRIAGSPGCAGSGIRVCFVVNQHRSSRSNGQNSGRTGIADVTCSSALQVA